jgi:two-component system, NarL family, sensor histidine kinase BarA
MQMKNHQHKLRILTIGTKKDLARDILIASQKAELQLEKPIEANLLEGIELLKKQLFDCVFWTIDPSLLSIVTIEAIKQNNINNTLVVIGDRISEEREIELLRAGITEYWQEQNISLRTIISCLYRTIEIKKIEQRSSILHGFDRNYYEADKKHEHRINFLSQVSVLLSNCDRDNNNLKTISWLAVPLLADWCAIEIFDLELTKEKSIPLSNIIVAHRHIDREEILTRLHQQYSFIREDREKQRQLWYRTQIDCDFKISDLELELLAEDNSHLYLLRQLEVKSYLFAKIVIEKQILGSILLGYSRSDLTYNKTDLYTIEEIAVRIAGKIERKKIDRQAKEINENLRNAANILNAQRKRLTVLQQLNSLLNQRLTNRAELLQVMADSVCEAIDRAQICSILLYDSEKQKQALIVTAGNGKYRLNGNDSFVWQEICWQQILLDRGDLTLHQDPNRSKKSADLPIIFYAVEIESIESGKLGVLAIGNWDDISAFSTEDKKLLNAVSEQAAIALDNARSIEILEKQYQILSEQNQQLELQRQNIEQKNQKLLEASQLKSQFLATMSHELRTPMNAIMGFSQYLLLPSQNSLTEKQQQSVERILSNSKNLLGLIDDILTFSKIEAERLEQKLEPIDLEKIIRMIISELLPLVDRNKVNLEFDCQSHDRIAILDRSQLRRIIVNLLDNAIKFTDVGEIIISLQDAANDRFLITVADTGIGIDREQIERIFEAFRQVDQSSTRRYSGTGLGLAITRSLVKLMQGEITVESKLGAGSTFRVILPKKQDKQLIIS